MKCVDSKSLKVNDMLILTIDKNNLREFPAKKSKETNSSLKLQKVKTIEMELKVSSNTKIFKFWFQLCVHPDWIIEYVKPTTKAFAQPYLDINDQMQTPLKFSSASSIKNYRTQDYEATRNWYPESSKINEENEIRQPNIFSEMKEGDNSLMKPSLEDILEKIESIASELKHQSQHNELKHNQLKELGKRQFEFILKHTDLEK